MNEYYIVFTSADVIETMNIYTGWECYKALIQILTQIYWCKHFDVSFVISPWIDFLNRNIEMKIFFDIEDSLI